MRLTNISFFLFYLCLFFSTGTIKGQINISKTLSTPSYGTEILKTRNGKFIVGGFRSSNNKVRFYLAKLDSNNKKLVWEKTGPYANSLGSDGDLAPYGTGGAVISGADTNNKATIASVDKSGSIQWEYHSNKAHTMFLDIKWEQKSSDYLAVGIKRDSQKFYPYVSKVTNKGYNVWNKVLDSISKNCIVNSAIPANDSGWLLTGFNQVDTNNYFYDLFVVKITQQGRVNWVKTYHKSSYQRGQCIIQGYESGYLIAGTNDDVSTPSTSPSLTKINEKGNIQWEKTFADTTGDDFPRSVIKDGAGHYIYVGHSLIPVQSGDENQHTVYKINQSGDIVWKKRSKKPGSSSYASDVAKVDSQKFILIGSRFINENDFIFTSLFSFSGQFASKPAAPVSQTNVFEIFPNPVTNRLTIKKSLQELKENSHQIIIYNNRGQPEMRKTLTGKQVLNVSKLPAATYFYRIIKSGEQISQSGYFVKTNP